MRFRFHILQVYGAAVLLAAILSGAVSFVFFKSNIHLSPEQVYCPLTKKLQPVYPPKTISSGSLLNEICAAGSEKTRLAAAISESFKVRFSTLNENNFESLAFDFWQKGKSSFENLPDLPSSPEKFLVKNFFAVTGFSSNFEIKSDWKATEKFSFQTQPRPPTASVFPEFNFEVFLKLNQISRRIAPRAPPLAV